MEVLRKVRLARSARPTLAPPGNGDVAPPGSAAFSIAVTFKDGEDPMAVASEKVREMWLMKVRMDAESGS